VKKRNINIDITYTTEFKLLADSNSVANTTSAWRAGEVDAAATTEVDGGRPGCDRTVEKLGVWS
jgi:hypothetical protein